MLHRRADGRVFAAGRLREPITVARRPNYDRPVGRRRRHRGSGARCSRPPKRPVIFAGNGVTLAEATDELPRAGRARRHSRRDDAHGARACFPEDHPLSLGMTGIWGTRAANDTTREADVILAVGTAFGEADCSSWNPKYTFAIPPSRADPDRHRSAGDRQDLSRRSRHRRRREGDAARARSRHLARHEADAVARARGSQSREARSKAGRRS